MLKLFSKKRKFDVEAFIAGSLQGMEHVIAGHRQAWRFGQEQSWRVDEQAGRISFCFGDGVVASAPVQIVGTFNTKHHSFIWGWQHPAVPPQLRLHAACVKAFGEKHHAKEFTEPQVPRCSEKRAWEYAALAMLLAEANGTYRVQVSQGIFVYMTFGDISIADPVPDQSSGPVEQTP